jgi:hypothetical protein
MAVVANAGVPMLFVGLPFMAALLLPVILIEAVWYWRFLRLPWSVAWRGSGQANLWSCCCGLPLAWFVWFLAGSLGVSLVTASGLVTQEQFLWSKTVGFLFLFATSAWLYPGGDFSDGVLLQGAGLVLLLPAYLVSYLGEARLLRRRWPWLEPRRLRRQVWLAHLITYGLLYVVAGCRFYHLTH